MSTPTRIGSPPADLEGTVRQMLELLSLWAGLPKYAVERRIDLFLTPFIASYVAAKVGCPGKLKLVVPEFPIRHGTNFQTVNVDYLLIREDVPAWYLVELKTDASSLDADQSEIYMRVARRPDAMKTLLGDISRVQERSTKKALRDKYDLLLELLKPHRAYENAGVQVVYLSPSPPRTPPDWFLRLHDMAGWNPPEHLQLWNQLAPLIARLDDGAPYRGLPVEWFQEGMGQGWVERVVREKGAWVAVDVGYQAGCLPTPNPRRPQAEWKPPQGRKRFTREEFEARQLDWDRTLRVRGSE